MAGLILHPNKKRADASTLFGCHPKASTAIDFILVDILCLSTGPSTSDGPEGGSIDPIFSVTREHEAPTGNDIYDLPLSTHTEKALNLRKQTRWNLALGHVP